MKREEKKQAREAQKQATQLKRQQARDEKKEARSWLKMVEMAKSKQAWMEWDNYDLLTA